MTFGNESMCGIFGLWNFEGAKGSHLLKASELLKHRGPDDEGFTVFENEVPKSFAGEDSAGQNFEKLSADSTISRAFLHRRLAILDLSPAGHQPMAHPKRNIHIVFNGEIYNYLELIAEYNLDVRTGTDTEMILLLYAKIGTAAFAKFRGMWALAIADMEQKKLVLSRDRFGIKPLFFIHHNGGLAFASEVKPLLFLPTDKECAGTEMKAQWERKKFLQFVVYGATDDPHETFFKGIEALKPGHFRTYDMTSLDFEQTQYYNLRERVAQGEYVNESFETLFSESIKEHLIADVEVGSCLSGGLDSSLIVAEAAKQLDGSFKTFTCSFPGESIDESDYARMLAGNGRKLDQHFTTPSAQEFMNGFDALIRSQERPFGSASIFAQAAVMKLAAENDIKVLLDGQGADEILGGYYPFAGAYLISLLRSGQVGAYKRELKALKKHFNPKMETAMMRSAFYALPQRLQILARRQKRLGYSLIDARFKEQASKLNSPERGATDFGELSYRSVEFGLYELLQYEDRNAMMYSIESRVPFLDHRLVEWAVGQDPEVKIQNGWTKYPIRIALEKHNLKPLAWRIDKLGFVAPQDRWRMELAEAILEKVNAAGIPELLDKTAVLNLFRKSLNSNSGLTEFWRIYALLRWMEVFDVELV